jgi:uncharacterized protein (DUF885 family)
VADWEAFERRERPLLAAREGDAGALGKLPGITPADEARRQAWLKDFAARLARVEARALPPEDAFNHRFLSREVGLRLEAHAFDDARLGFTSEGGAGITLGYVARAFTVTRASDAHAWLRLLDAAPGFMRDAQANARRGLETGFTQPRSVVESALRIAEAEVALPAEQDPMVRPFARLPASIPASEQEALRAEARRKVAEGLAPARREWARFLREDYLPKARAELGVAALPGGRAYYAFQVRSYTTTDLTPDQVHAVGLREVARIRGEMDGVVKEAGFSGPFADFLRLLRTDPRFYAKSRQELMEKASEIAKRADDKLPSLFKRALPRLTYGVREVPRELEENYTTGRYSGGSLERGVAGAYLVNTSKLDQRPLYELPALTLHEAAPGHHLERAMSQELGEQPWFRRHTDATAFTEGWGLYSEFLGQEMGIYRDAYERFGRLSYEMWRACRLVADTGIHWKGWSLEQARACFRDNSALAPHNIETELQRYVGWPGQALAYKIGELKLKELRARAEARLGERFDVRAFHDALLLDGPMPLGLLEERMDAWLAAQAAPAGPGAPAAPSAPGAPARRGTP